MNRTLILSAMATFGLAFAASADAALVVKAEDVTINQTSAGTGSLHLYFSDVTGNTSLLQGFDFQVTLTQTAGPAGAVEFVSPFVERPDDYVFDPAGTSPANFSSNATVVQAASDQAAPVSIDLNENLIRIPFSFTGENASFTVSFVGTLSDGEAAISYTTETGAINVVPEPASLGLLAVGGLLLRRRRA